MVCYSDSFLRFLKKSGTKNFWIQRSIKIWEKENSTFQEDSFLKHILRDTNIMF